MTPRSYLFAPGHDPRLLGKVMDAGADAVVLDLEDGVPADAKEVGRRQVRALIDARGSGDGPEIWVRPGALTSDEWRRDVEAVVAPGLCGLRVPKAESPECLAELGLTLLTLESRCGLEAGTLRLTCTIESAAGLLACGRFKDIPRVGQLAFGEADFVADIGAAPIPEATLWARSQMVVLSRAAGFLPPIAPVYTHLEDEEGLRRSSEQNRDLGFGARSCIHPRQLDVVHRVFSPSSADIAWAREVERAGEDGTGMAGDQFVDEAVLRRARTVLSRAAEREA